MTAEDTRRVEISQQLYQPQKVEIENGIEGETLSVSTNFRHGNDTLVVFIHGLGGNKDAFSEVWDRDELKGESILVPDLIGFGDSTHTSDFSYTIEDHAAILKKLISNYPHRNLHIVAHSMGGAVGVLLAEQLPELQSFVNIDGNLIKGDGGLISRNIAGLPFEEFRDREFDSLRQQMTRSKGVGFQRWVTQSRQSDLLAFHKSAQSLVTWSDSGQLLEKYNRLPVRKVFVFGDRNKEMNVLSRLNPNETLMISNSGHFSMNDSSNEFYPKIAAFIKKTG